MTCSVDNADDLVLTPEEKKAIAALRRVAKIWPESLWLYSASGSLTIMRKTTEGKRGVEIRGGAESVDRAYIVGTVDIPNDGGDW